MTINSIDELKIACKECNLCNLNNKRTLLPHGNVKAKIMFIGESPSLNTTEEDVKIFSQKSKEIYDKILSIFNTTIDEVYTTNLIKCTEPFSHTGSEYHCRKYLDREIEIVNPKIIVVLSKKAANFLYPARQCPGYYHEQNKEVILLWHPMFVARNVNNAQQYFATLNSLILEMHHTLLNKESSTQSSLLSYNT